MITLQDYFSDKPHPNEYNLNALTLLYRVNNLLAAYTTDTGKLPEINKVTGTLVSGSKGVMAVLGYQPLQQARQSQHIS
jgi:hypothetical protein